MLRSLARGRWKRARSYEAHFIGSRKIFVERAAAACSLI